MSVLNPNTRAAALWALGYLHADQPDEALTQQLFERAMDDDVQIPEDLEVRRMAVISLGRMKAAMALDGMRTICHRSSLQSALGYAAAWTIRELTGEEIPAIPPYVVWEEDWFLMPNEKRE
jgi:HEAT repeat protein